MPSFEEIEGQYSDDAKLDYFREDSLFHMFHYLLHKLHEINGGKLFERVNELFWSTDDEEV